MPLSKSRKAGVGGGNHREKKGLGVSVKGRGDFDSDWVNQQIFIIHICCGKHCRCKER